MIGSRSVGSAAAGYRFPGGGIAVALRWLLRCGLGYRDIHDLLVGCGITVDHAAVYWWV
jgi:transposase-like protein